MHSVLSSIFSFECSHLPAKYRINWRLDCQSTERMHIINSQKCKQKKKNRRKFSWRLFGLFVCAWAHGWTLRAFEFFSVLFLFNNDRYWTNNLYSWKSTERRPEMLVDIQNRVHRQRSPSTTKMITAPVPYASAMSYVRYYERKSARASATACIASREETK